MDKYYIPDGASLQVAQQRVTHMAIGAHQDDLEIFAYHGIAACYGSPTRWFAGVTVTDGGGSARKGPYRDYSDEQMKTVRFREQNRAAELGGYSFQAQLGIPSRVIKDPQDRLEAVEALRSLLLAARPETLYLHNPADKHETHIAVLACCLKALRSLEPEERPRQVYGCEVWRDLDWLADEEKVALPVDAHPILARDLIAVFESQVVGGKDYVTATLGRRSANATYFQSHSVDEAGAYTFAMDLNPLLQDDRLTMEAFVESKLERFRMEVRDCIQKYELS